MAACQRAASWTQQGQGYTACAYPSVRVRSQSGETGMEQPDVDFLIRLSLLACMFE